MALLSLSLSEPHVVWDIGTPFLGNAGWKVGWKVRFSRWVNVKLATGGDLSKISGSLVMRVGKMETPTEPDPEDEKKLFFERCGPPIGLVNFLKASPASSDGVVKAQPDCYEVSLLVSEEELQSIITKVLAGQGPREVSANVPDFRYGYFPDGSDQNWNNSERDWAKVDSATFVFLDRPQEEPKPEETPLFNDVPEPPRTSPEREAIIDLNNNLMKAAVWILLLLAGIFAALLFHH